MITNALLLVLIGLGVYLAFALRRQPSKVIEKIQQPIVHQQTADMRPFQTLMEKTTDKIVTVTSNKVLETIKGSTNNMKGDLGEMIGYIQLKSIYDKVIPFHGIVDFICLKFPKGDDPGKLVFIDIKTDNARLSKDQRWLKTLIDGNRIEFKKVVITTENMSDSNENSSS